MAHEVEVKKDGIASLVLVGESAWHRLGTRVDVAPDWESAIKLGRADYDVKKIRCSRPDGKGGQVVTDAYVTVRTDEDGKDYELGVVQERYKVIQNVDAFRILRPLTEEGVAKVEVCGVIRNGQDAWMLVKLNIDDIVKGIGGALGEFYLRENIQPYILVANNFSGRRGILVALTPVRVVCANTMGAAERGRLSDQMIVHHTEGAEDKLVEAAKTLWGDLIEHFKRITEAYEMLKGTYLDLNDFNRLVVAPLIDIHPEKRPKFVPDARMANSVVERYERKQKVLTEAWTGGIGHSGDHSAWEAYQGVIESLDHCDLFPARTGVYQGASHLDGQIRKSKTQVFENLVKFARGDDELAELMN